MFKIISFAISYLTPLLLLAAEPTTKPSTQPTQTNRLQTDAPQKFEFNSLLNVWEYMRKNSKELRVNLDEKKNGIQSLSVFCSRDDALELKGFWVITHQNFKECYVFAETDPKRIAYKDFLDIIGLQESWREISLEDFNRQLELNPNEQIVKTAVTEDEKAKLRRHAVLIENIRRFVRENNSPERIAKTDVEIAKEETDKKLEEFRRTLELMEKQKP